MQREGWGPNVRGVWVGASEEKQGDEEPHDEAGVPGSAPRPLPRCPSPRVGGAAVPGAGVPPPLQTWLSPSECPISRPRICFWEWCVCAGKTAETFPVLPASHTRGFLARSPRPTVSSITVDVSVLEPSFKVTASEPLATPYPGPGAGRLAQGPRSPPCKMGVTITSPSQGLLSGSDGMTQGLVCGNCSIHGGCFRQFLKHFRYCYSQHTLRRCLAGL